MQLVVARVARAHGLRGEVALDVRTDDPGRRLAPGARLSTDRAGLGPVVVARAACRQGRWYVTVEGVVDRTGAQALAGVELLVEVDDEAAQDADPDSWYRHELVGLRAQRVGDHLDLGTVIGLEHPPAHDVLVLREPDGAVTRVPFVRAIVPVVDVAGGRVLLDPPGGLLAALPAADDEA